MRAILCLQNVVRKMHGAHRHLFNDNAHIALIHISVLFSLYNFGVYVPQTYHQGRLKFRAGYMAQGTMFETVLSGIIAVNACLPCAAICKIGFLV